MVDLQQEAGVIGIRSQVTVGGQPDAAELRAWLCARVEAGRGGRSELCLGLAVSGEHQVVLGGVVGVGGAGRYAGLAGDGAHRRAMKTVARDEREQCAAHGGGAVHRRDRHAAAAARRSIAIPVSRSETSHSAAIALSMSSLRTTGLRTGGPLLTNRGP